MNNLLSGIIQERIYMALFGCCISIVPLNAATGIIPKTNYENLQTKKKVHGIIRDQNGEPIIGARIMEKSRNNGTITNFDGEFTLSVFGNQIEISYIGYVTQVITVSNQLLEITLKEDSKQLDEIIVVGYGAVKRKNFTGSVSTVNTENSPIALKPTTNALDALRGTATGITVSQQQGAGQSPSLLVRGQKSINGGTSPLLVVDGIIYMGNYRDIEPSIIKSISILKDATSLAAYGSKAANGVIMITTKQGRLGKPVINISTSRAYSKETVKPNFSTSQPKITDWTLFPIPQSVIDSNTGAIIEQNPGWD